MKPVRLGLIGLGGMASVHAEHISKLEGVSIVAVCDNDAGKRADWGKRLGIGPDARHPEPEALIRSPDVDAVLSITPNHVHAEIIRLCLIHGKPVMTEKPFTRTFEEALALKELAETRDVPCMVGFSYRYVPSFRMARDLIRSGRIGAVRHVSVQYLQQWGSPLFETKMNWRMDRAITGTGVLGDLGSHMIDAARFLIGEPVQVSALLQSLITEREDPATGKPVPVDIERRRVFDLGASERRAVRGARTDRRTGSLQAQADARFRGFGAGDVAGGNAGSARRLSQPARARSRGAISFAAQDGHIG
jgi:predicted dehydrogenase